MPHRSRVTVGSIAAFVAVVLARSFSGDRPRTGVLVEAVALVGTDALAKTVAPVPRRTTRPTAGADKREEHHR